MPNQCFYSTGLLVGCVFMSCVTCHVSHVTFFLSFIFSFFYLEKNVPKKIGKRGKTSWFRICYQRGLPRLVSIYTPLLGISVPLLYQTQELPSSSFTMLPNWKLFPLSKLLDIEPLKSYKLLMDELTSSGREGSNSTLFYIFIVFRCFHMLLGVQNRNLLFNLVV